MVNMSKTSTPINSDEDLVAKSPLMRCINPMSLYEKLVACYGPQKQWWPGEGTFEVIFGAVLTQNTTWKNVEKAINNLKSNNLLNKKAISTMHIKKLEELIRPAGFYKQKARYLKEIVNITPNISRKELLKLKGVGEETADSILLYAYNRPEFVVDAYTRRICSRLTNYPLDNPKKDYKLVKFFFESAIDKDAELFKEFHALFVEHAKLTCRKKPLCKSCCLKDICSFYKRGR